MVEHLLPKPARRNEAPSKKPPGLQWALQRRLRIADLTSNKRKLGRKNDICRETLMAKDL